MPEPYEAGLARQKTNDAIRKRDWGGAIDAYAEYIETLTTRHGRDVKLLTWILDEYARAANARRVPVDLAAFEKIVDEKIKAYEKRPLILWRLHLLKADLARFGNDPVKRKAELQAAIESYPTVVYADPPAQDYLHKIYNEAALILAQEEGLQKAEETILQQFREDPRFVYFDLSDWSAYILRVGGKLHEVTVLARKVVQAYDEKIKAHPEQADTLKWYRLEMQETEGKLLVQELSVP